ncbi:MAG: thiosulfate sulfurtransferase [Deltaproteobacteria bacterium]|jgi:rhodanese-related sulfurtransferase|nr:thiosulfate sulfurtransferase [Deltaproteobacteria bacterium]
MPGLSGAFPKQTTPANLDETFKRFRQLAVLDVREKKPYFDEHFLKSSSLPLSELEARVPVLVPGQGTPIILIDWDGAPGGQAAVAAERLGNMGYVDVSVLAGGLVTLKGCGRVLFTGVGTLPKAFGEWVAETYRTPYIEPDDFIARKKAGERFSLIDCRPFEEFRTMTIPGSVNAPGVELIPRVQELLGANRESAIVVHCAGRTRGIVATQSLINAGVDCPVMTLKNGTMGWQLAGHQLVYGQDSKLPKPGPLALEKARRVAEDMAQRYNVHRFGPGRLLALMEDRSTFGQPKESLFVFDVRSREEYEAGHLPGSIHVQGGQLIQALDEHVGVFGAKIALIDDDSIRAGVTAGWLIQMGWNDVVAVTMDREWLESDHVPLETGPSRPTGMPKYKWPEQTHPHLARELMKQGQVVTLDFSRSDSYRAGHLPGALWASRSESYRAHPNFKPKKYVLVTSEDGVAANLAAKELSLWLTGSCIMVLEGGNRGWQESGLILDNNDGVFLTEPVDYWYRPYMDPNSSVSEKEAYFQWEYSLVGQLQREGSVSFKVY